VNSELRATVTTPAGREEIVVRTHAGLHQSRCVIRVVRGGAAAAMSDSALVADARRRGLL
jgi:hypothetical protein